DFFESVKNSRYSNDGNRMAQRINKNADGKDDERGRQCDRIQQPKARRRRPTSASARRAKGRDRAARSSRRTGISPPQSPPAARRESAEPVRRSARASDR